MNLNIASEGNSFDTGNKNKLVELIAQVDSLYHTEFTQNNFYVSDSGHDAGIEWSEKIIDLKIKLVDAPQNIGYNLNQMIYYYQYYQDFLINNPKRIHPLYCSFISLEQGDIIKFSLEPRSISYHFYGNDYFGGNSNFSNNPQEGLDYYQCLRCSLKRIDGKLFSKESSLADIEIVKSLEVLEKNLTNLGLRPGLKNGPE